MLSEGEARWADKPNRLSLHAAPADCPMPQTSVTVFLTDGTQLAAVFVRKRGWDIPGGHIEVGETTLEAAVREVWEEAGVRIGEHELELLGWTHLEVLAPKPEAYAYPYPHTYQPVYLCRVAEERLLDLTPQATEEISKAALLPLATAQELFHDRDWSGLLARLGE